MAPAFRTFRPGGLNPLEPAWDRRDRRERMTSGGQRRRPVLREAFDAAGRRTRFDVFTRSISMLIMAKRVVKHIGRTNERPETEEQAGLAGCGARAAGGARVD